MAMNFSCSKGGLGKLKLHFFALVKSDEHGKPNKTFGMKAHCDTKLKKLKAASGILMIRQNSFHEILSLLLCHLPPLYPHLVIA